MTDLRGRAAVVHGAGGAVGGALARAFARAGARIFLAGRRAGPVEALAEQIRRDGGRAEAAAVDAFDRDAVEAHMEAVVARAGAVDVAANAVGFPQAGVQGTPLLDLAPERFEAPVAAYARTNFLTAAAAGRRMAERGSGVILAVTAIPARAPLQLVGGMGPAWAAVEALTRGLAAELGPRGVRAVCLRSHAIPETPLIGEVTEMVATGAGVTPDAIRAGMADRTMLGRLPTLEQIGAVAAFLASDAAATMTGTVANVSAGAAPD